MNWHLSHRSDDRARPLADRHYNRQKIGAKGFVPPGRCLVLCTEKADAFWVTSWPFGEYVRHRWPGAWVCSAFRNESPVLSSLLIREAVAATRFKWWPHTAGVRGREDVAFVTFVDARHVRRKRDLGRCYIRAGWEPDGETAGGLVALVLRSSMLQLPMEPKPMITATKPPSLSSADFNRLMDAVKAANVTMVVARNIAGVDNLNVTPVEQLPRILAALAAIAKGKAGVGASAPPTSRPPPSKPPVVATAAPADDDGRPPDSFISPDMKMSVLPISRRALNVLNECKILTAGDAFGRYFEDRAAWVEHVTDRMESVDAGHCEWAIHTLEKHVAAGKYPELGDGESVDDETGEALPKCLPPTKSDAENAAGAAEIKASRDSLSKSLIKAGVDPAAVVQAMITCPVCDNKRNVAACTCCKGAGCVPVAPNCKPCDVCGGTGRTADGKGCIRCCGTAELPAVESGEPEAPQVRKRIHRLCICTHTRKSHPDGGKCKKCECTAFLEAKSFLNPPLPPKAEAVNTETPSEFAATAVVDVAKLDAALAAQPPVVRDTPERQRYLKAARNVPTAAEVKAAFHADPTDADIAEYMAAMEGLEKTAEEAETAARQVRNTWRRLVCGGVTGYVNEKGVK